MAEVLFVDNNSVISAVKACKTLLWQKLGTSIYPTSFPRRRESMNIDVSGNGGDLSALFC
jgi:hypothetical protein